MHWVLRGVYTEDHTLCVTSQHFPACSPGIGEDIHWGEGTYDGDVWMFFPKYDVLP